MERKHLIRLPPCPDYDIAGTETWLEDMAREGWLLGESGFFCGLAFFDRAEPQEMTYRLTAALQSTSLFAENGGEPDREEKTLNAAYGWEYVGNRGQFYIYRTPGRAERELHTDPAVQALAVEAVRKRQRGSLFTTVFWAILYPLAYMKFAVIYTAIALGLGLSLLWAAFLLAGVGDSLWRTFYYGRLKRRLEEGEDLEHHKDWRRDRRFYRVRQGAWWLLLALVIGLSVNTFRRAEESEIPIAEDTGTVPFATLADLAGGGVENYEAVLPRYNTVFRWSNALAETVEWNESASMTCSDGTPFSGGLDVTYHELANEWMARRLVEEYYRKDKGGLTRRDGFQDLSLPDLGLDEARAYVGLFPTVLLRQGNKVLRAVHYETGPEESRLALEEWAGLLADSTR